MNSHIRKSEGVKSGDLGGHVIGPPFNTLASKLVIGKGFHWVGIHATGHVQGETWKISASFREVPTFLYILIWEI
jgi:hypothetical protein